MVSISRLLCGMKHYGDTLRYRAGGVGALKPIVVWNITRACNLNCRHCYTSSEGATDPDELSTQEARQLIGDLAEWGVPVLLFSGGEPLLRPDLAELIDQAVQRGIRVILSTNGTLLDQATARKFKALGVSYVGISLDGIGANHDRLRGRSGAYTEALRGLRHCRQADLPTGLRLTLNRRNYQELDAIFQLIAAEDLKRVCFYHLAYTGRGNALIGEDLTRRETRAVVDWLINRTFEIYQAGRSVEVLTVDNHCDAVYLYLKLLREESPRAAEVYRLLEQSGGNRSGIAIGAIDWQGEVFPDQFTRNHSLGNIRHKKFGAIWTEPANPILAGLKNRAGLIGGRCLKCRWFKLCNGNLRARAEAVYQDFWAEDPACYLTDEEIG